MKNITIKECCAICEYLYDERNCPLYSVYDMATKCGDNTFDIKAKYKVFCEEFDLDSKFNKAMEE